MRVKEYIEKVKKWYSKFMTPVSTREKENEENGEISQEDCKLYKNTCIGVLDQLRLASSRHHRCPVSARDLEAIYQMMDLIVGRKSQRVNHPHRRATDKEGLD